MNTHSHPTIKLTESVDARNARLTRDEQKRRDLATKELAKIIPRRAQVAAQLSNMIGDGQYVIYTGSPSCPVFVKLNEERDGVLPNIGLEWATRLSLDHAKRWAPLIRNGNNEEAHYCVERRAYEMELALLDSVKETFEMVLRGEQL